jgi:hypothetical protein
MRDPRFRPARRQRGFVLAVVLVLLVTLTVVVTAQVQRATVGQALTTNSSDYLLAETAAQSVLRYCEAAVMQSIGQPDSVRTTTPGTRGVDVAAWRDAGKWAASSVTLNAGAVAFPGVAGFACLFEDATGDLVPSQLQNDLNAESGGAALLCAVQPSLSPRLCKYRVTARVTLERGRQLHLQSELRFAI